LGCLKGSCSELETHLRGDPRGCDRWRPRRKPEAVENRSDQLGLSDRRDHLAPSRTRGTREAIGCVHPSDQVLPGQATPSQCLGLGQGGLQVIPDHPIKRCVLRCASLVFDGLSPSRGLGSGTRCGRRNFHVMPRMRAPARRKVSGAANGKQALVAQSAKRVDQWAQQVVLSATRHTRFRITPGGDVRAADRERMEDHGAKPGRATPGARQRLSGGRTPGRVSGIRD
jgi:hypothetical protein